MEILTTHLSTYAAFTIDYENTAKERIRPLTEYLYPYRIYSPFEAVANIREIVCSTEGEEILYDTFKDSEALWQQVTFDGIYSLTSGVGLSTDWLDQFQKGFGYLGIAISVCDLLRYEWRGDQQNLANTAVSAICNTANMIITNAVTTSALTASMGVVAFVGIALNKFGLAVQEKRADLFRDAYHLFYEKKNGITDNHYRSAPDWFKIFYPMFQRPLTKETLYALIDNNVTDYCREIWKNKNSDDWTMCLAEAHKSYPFTWDGGLNEALKEQLAMEYRAELYNDVLPTVFAAIRKRMLAEREKEALKAQKDFLELMNKVVRVQFRDSSYDGKTPSVYAGCTLRMDGLPDKITDRQQWQTVINERGEGEVAFRTAVFVRNLMPGRFMLANIDGDEKECYEFELPASRRAAKQTIVKIDLASEGKPAPDPHLKGLNMTYDPDTLGFKNTLAITKLDDDLSTMKSHVHYHSRRTHTIMVAEGDTAGCFFYRAGHKAQTNPFTMRSNIHAAVAQYFAGLKTITIDKEAGKIHIGKDIVGTYDVTTGQGFGTFTISTSYPFEEQTEEYFNRPGTINFDGDFDNTHWNTILEGTMNHTFTGDFVVSENPLTHVCELSFEADGTWALSAVVADTVQTGEVPANAITFEPLSPFKLLTTRTDNLTGKVHLSYTTHIARKPDD